MEGATASFWKRNYFQDLFDIDRELNASVFLEPAPSVAAASAELAINPFQNTTDTDRKRKGSGASRDAAAEKKRLVDRAYRERCKEMKKKTETKLDVLTKENDGLRRENNYLKNEGTQLVQTLQHQKDGMKQLEKEFGQIKSQLHRQNTVVEVLSKRLVLKFENYPVCSKPKPWFLLPECHLTLAREFNPHKVISHEIRFQQAMFREKGLLLSPGRRPCMFFKS